MKLKTTVLSTFCLLPLALQAMETEPFPVISQDSEILHPENIDQYAEKMPEAMKQEIAGMIKNDPELFKLALGTAHRPYYEALEETEQIKKAFAQRDIEVRNSHSNFVARFGDLFLKFVRPGIKMAYAAEKAKQQLAFNTVEQMRRKSDEDIQKWRVALRDLGHKLHDMNEKNPELGLYDTYQAFSAVAGYHRSRQAKATYNHDMIEPAPTYYYLLNPNEVARDGNCFVVQDAVPGTRLDALPKMTLLLAEKELLKRALKQFCVHSIAAHMWNNDLIIRKDMKLTPVDFEKRDRYVRNTREENGQLRTIDYIDVAESKNLAGFMFELMYAALKHDKQLLAVWDGMLLEHTELAEVAHMKEFNRENWDAFKQPKKKTSVENE